MFNGERFCFMAISLMVFTTPVFAGGITEGANTVGVNFSASDITFDDRDSDFQRYSAEFNYGYFVTNALEIGGSVSYFAFDSDNSDSSTTNLSGLLNYHFNTREKLVPFAGVHGGYSYFDSSRNSDSSFSYGPQAGIKYFATESSSFDLKLSGTRTDRGDLGGKSWETRLSAGISYYF